MTAESADSGAESSSESAEPASQRPEDALIGTTLLDAYKVVRVMGEGGMGRIYEAHHTRLTERRFAIKVLRPELVTSSPIRARFQREVEAVSRVTHPGVLTIVDVGTTSHGWPFMVSEHLNGLDLLAYLRRFGALPSDRAVHMGCRIAEALEATHAAGVIHRDIKPSNIFLLGAFEPLGPEWDRVKIIDFGLSRVVSRDDQLTKTGIVMGTPAYMSPEQASGERTDHLTDVYGVGAVLYAAATGVPPFREETPQQTVLAVLSREPARPREVNPALVEGLEAVIQRAMAKRPADRHPSMSALRLDLSNLELSIRARASRGRTSRSPAVVLPGSAVGVRLRVLGLAGAGLLLCLGALASALVGIVSVLGPDFQLTTGERALFAISLGVAVALFLLGVWRFERRSWANTARLVDALPRLRTPLLTALVVYALASFAIRLSADVVARSSWSPGLTPPHVAWPGWSALLSLGAIAAGFGVALHQNWWEPMRPLRRWAWAVGLTSSVALAAFSLARWGSWGFASGGADGNRGSVLGRVASGVSFSALGSGVPDA
ncbi:MAG TPA: serine/threonine-protein kinase, partial [Polyangiaceae bacterium]|nr:serine/threonine-protein kinase [Polyangiaceae bacterium]